MSKVNIKENVKIRELLMQAVFQMEATRNATLEQLKVFLQGEKLSESNEQYIADVFLKLVDNLDDIDYLINKYSKEWTVDRIPKTDLAILRLALCEMKYIKKYSSGIVINDAVNMAKKFSEDDAYKYINGILGNVYRKEIENE